MKKGIFLLGVLSVLSLLALDAKAVEISDLKATGVEDVKAGQTRTIVFAFKSSHAPEDLFIEYYGAGRRVTWAWKKNQVEVTAEKEEGIFEIRATRQFYAGPRGGFTVDAEVWVTAGKEKSNTLKSGIPVSAVAETTDSRSGTPLPADMKVEYPSKSVPSKISALSGMWQGSDNFGTAWAIVVESITPEEVVGIWSWGTHTGRKASWIRAKGKIDDDRILLTWEYPPDPKAILTLKLKDEKNAFADFTQGSLYLKAWLTRK